MGSKKQSAPAAPPPDPVAQAQAITNAKLQTDPLNAQNQFNILNNPNYGLLPTTQLEENVRQQVFPQENQVRQQLAQNIYQQLLSPTGITPDQQDAIDARRQIAQNNLVKALRERANLGGNLYSGNAGLNEGRQVGELQNAFAEEDINRQERAKLNSMQSALPFLQMLFPNVGITAPNYQSAVQDPNAYSSSLTNYNNNLFQQQAQQQQNQNALYSALFQGLGTAAGGYLGRK